MDNACDICVYLHRREWWRYNLSSGVMLTFAFLPNKMYNDTYHQQTYAQEHLQQ